MILKTVKTAVYGESPLILQIANFLPLFLMLVLVILTYSNTADDTDFWWSLKHGEFIYTTHGIPSRDEYSFTTYSADRIAKDLNPSRVGSEKESDFWVNHNIRQGWLAQLLFYVVYRVSGFLGIAIFKSLLFAFAYLAAFFSMLKRGGKPLASLLVLALIALIGADFNYTRTQLFSFWLFTSMLYMFYDFKEGGKTIYALPILMLVWANLHGGFILGDVILAIIASAETIKYVMHRRFPLLSAGSLRLQDLKKLLGITLLSLIASLVNPNGYTSFLFPYYLGHSAFGTIMEYMSPMLYEYHAYWGMLALVVISLAVALIRKRFDLTDLAVSTVVIVGSLRGIRFIPFFALGTAPVLASALSSSWERLIESQLVKRILSPLPGVSRVVRLATSLLICIVLVAAISHKVIEGRVVRAEVRESWYPTAAAAFIKQEGLRGNMYNLYAWGGFLIWALGPEQKTFVDGRNTNENAFLQYFSILTAETGNDPVHPLWKRLLDAYGVDVILVSAVSTAGVIQPLVDRLYADSQWELVFADGKSMVFLRDTVENRPVVLAHRISKEAILDEIIAECQAGITASPATWGYYEVLGYTYFKKNRPADALAMFNKYLSMNPRNENVKAIRDILQHYSPPQS